MGWQLEDPPEKGRAAWGASRAESWREVPQPLLSGKDQPEDYDPEDGLIDAVNVAIELGQPLLLTGEPGAGKTSFASHVGWQLGLGECLRSQVRTDMESKDLFYRYDNLARFRAAQEEDDRPPEDFLTLQALGEAIVRAADPNVHGDLRKRLLPDVGEPRRSVVLIDEIDKAPRDVPNDLLGYLTAERLWFNVPELGGRGADRNVIEAAREFQPIIICTSNSEKSLPDAFLRRCVFYDITFPKAGGLKKILERRINALPRDSNLSDDIAKLILGIREEKPVKAPGLAEAIGFALALMRRGYVAESHLEPNGPWVGLAKITLLKMVEDQRNADRLFGAMRRVDG